MPRSQGKYSQAARTLRILDRLRGRRTGVLLDDLATEFGVSTRQIRYDLLALEEASYVIEYGLRDGRAIATMVEASSRAVPLTRRERYTLLAVRHIFDALKGTPFYEDAVSVSEKLSELLTPGEREELATFGERFMYVPDGGVKEYEGKEEVLDALQTGVLRRRWVQFAYRSLRGSEQRGILAPYAMVIYRQGIYVVSRVFYNATEATELTDDRGRICVLAAERFESAECIPRLRFERPTGFKLDDLFHGAFGVYISESGERHHVVVDFSPERRGHVMARRWHPAQQVTPLENGGVRLEFDVSALNEVSSWVLGWGPHARVVAPAILAEMVMNDLEAAITAYSSALRGLPQAA